MIKKLYVQMKRRIMSGVLLMTIIMSTLVSGGAGVLPVKAEDYSDYLSIQLILTNMNVNVNGVTEYRITASKTDGTKVDVTDMAAVSCNQTSKADINTAEKKIKGLDSGTVNITASLGTLSNTAALNINDFDSSPIRIAGQVVVNESFEGAAPSFVPSGDTACSIVTDGSSNHVLLVDGLTAGVKKTGSIEGDYGNSDTDSDYLVEADIKQVNCVASSNGGISFHVRNSGDSNDYMFRYMDTIKYNPATNSYGSMEYSYKAAADSYVRDGTYANTNYGSSTTLTVKKDSTGYSRKTFLRFNFSEFPENSTQSARLKLTIQSIGADATRTIKLYSLSDSDENWGESTITWNNAPVGATFLGQKAVSNTDASVEWDVTSFINSQLTDKTVSFMLVNEGSASVESTLNLNSKESAAGKPELILSSSQEPQRDRIGIARNSNDNLRDWYYGAFGAAETGVLNKANRSFNNNYYRMSALIGKYITKPYPSNGTAMPLYDNLILRIAAPNGVQQVSCTTSDTDYLSTGKPLTRLTKGKVYLEVENTKAYFDNIEITKLNIARGIRLFIKDAMVAPGQPASFEVRAYTSADAYTVIPNDRVSISATDSTSLNIDRAAGTITANAEGEYLITATAADAIDPAQTRKYTAKLTVRSDDISEDFGTQDSTPDNNMVSNPDILSVPSTDLLTDENGNQVYRLRDGVSRLFGNEDWTNYEVQGKVKIVNPMIDTHAYNTAFEVIMRRKAVHGEYLGQGGFPFVYRITDDNAANYMRINTSPGPRVNIVDSSWHTFSAKASNNQYIFTLDNTVQYYASGSSMSGGFSFRAENCEVYIDDITVRKLEGDPYPGNPPQTITSITADNTNVTANKYDTVSIAELTAIKANYSGGKFKYITKDGGLSFSITAGSDKAEIFNGDTFRFKSNAADGDTVTVHASYEGVACDINITAAVPAGSEIDYVKSGTQIRQESLLYKLRNAYEKADSPPYAKNYWYLSEIFGKMMLNPEEMNYDDEINWMMDEIAYDESRPDGRAVSAGDFYFAQMMILYKMLDGRVNVSSSVWDDMINQLKTINYSNPTEFLSENHRILYFVCGYLVSETWPDAVMWNGKTGLENQLMFKGYLKDWINRRLKMGMGEYDSVSYYGIDIGGLSILYTFASDPTAKSMAFDMLDYLFADMAVDSLEANIGGAHARTYADSPDTLLFGMSNYAADFLFNTSIWHVDEAYTTVQVQAGLVPISSYRPSDAVYAIALDRDKRFDNKERKAIYTIPDSYSDASQSIKKYTHVTPEYTLGSVQQQEIAVFDNMHFQGMQEIPWSLTFGKSMGAVIFDSHPGVNETDSSYFIGNRGIIDYKYFQESNVVLGMHKITNASMPQFTHFWIPKAYFDEVVDGTGCNGWIFIRKDGAFAAIKMLRNGSVTNVVQYSWTKSGKWADIEAKINSANTAFICEAADSTEFSGTFEDFKAAILSNEASNPITYVINNGYYIQYKGLNGKTLKLNYNTDERDINGTPVDFNAYKSHEVVNPGGTNYVSADWNTGVITIAYGSLSRTIQPITDNMPPVTTPSIAGDGTSGWYVSDAVITLNASDNLSGVDKIEYRIGDSGDWIIYANPIVISQDGEYILQYRSTDKAGNAEDIKQDVIKIDKTAPATNAVLEGTVRSDGTYNSYVVLTLTVVEAVYGSGVAKTEYSFDGTNWLPYTVPVTITEDGMTNIYFKSTDNAGNTEVVQDISIHISMDPDILTSYLIEKIEGMTIEQGIKNSLTSKLNNIQKAIQKGNKESPVNVLNAFINEVDAQNGKKLTAAQADDLKTAASKIITSINTAAGWETPE